VTTKTTAAPVVLGLPLTIVSRTSPVSTYPSPAAGCHSQNQSQTAPWYEQITGVYRERTSTSWTPIQHTGNEPGDKHVDKLNHSVYQLHESGCGYCRR